MNLGDSPCAHSRTARASRRGPFWCGRGPRCRSGQFSGMRAERAPARPRGHSGRRDVEAEPGLEPEIPSLLQRERPPRTIAGPCVLSPGIEPGACSFGGSRAIRCATRAWCGRRDSNPLSCTQPGYSRPRLTIVGAPTWCDQGDSNPPSSGATIRRPTSGPWPPYARTDSNRRSPGCGPGALAAELRAHTPSRSRTGRACL
jgi:hypothetical protein